MDNFECFSTVEEGKLKLPLSVNIIEKIIIFVELNMMCSDLDLFSVLLNLNLVGAGTNLFQK